MRTSVRNILGIAMVILGCCALAFAGLLADLIWGGCRGGECYVTLSSLGAVLKTLMAISIVVGIGIMILGLLLRRAQPSSDADPAPRRLP
jgi:hypothetical protein